MKIKKKEFKVHMIRTKEPLVHIEQVTYPFIPQIISNKLKVFISMSSDLRGKEMTADWKHFELALFNII